MNTENTKSDTKIIAQVAAILDKLGPFTKDTPRKDKWRATEQLAHEIFVKTGEKISLDELDRVLRQYEADYRERMKHELPPNALVRVAKYPDRTTVLPLWGSTKHQ